MRNNKKLKIIIFKNFTYFGNINTPQYYIIIYNININQKNSEKFHQWQLTTNPFRRKNFN